MIENSDVLKKVLTTLMNISGRKTTKGYAIMMMDSLLTDLEEEYDFLKHVAIKDTRFLEDDDTITVMSDVDSVTPSEVGGALSSIIKSMNESLGKNAGHFFMKEIARNIGYEYNSTIKDMGVNLNLLQLEYEVAELEKRLINTRRT